ncbi:hypothetical protein ACFFSY_34580 [Paenibacillus aurantiacus]|uniref:Uncharacterized protein n=1 Tax=Paenibacillus aurantiacus TaxID=1936118 RepID=A0ABV5L0U2_9BACL
MLNMTIRFMTAVRLDDRHRVQQLHTFRDLLEERLRMDRQIQA